ncbi:MAG TPA: alpha-1,2-fucosyltransferase [Candidatus Paceibacterota bacterium]
MVITRLQGGMGNQMFQYAAGRALAIKNNTSLGLDLEYLLDRTPRKGFTFRNYDLDLFSIEAEIVQQANIPFLYRGFGSGKVALLLNKLRDKILPAPGKEKGFSFDPSVLNLGSDMYLYGYWQSYKYFESITETIRKDFTPRLSLPQNVQELKKEIESKNSVCIHVRRGDYVGNSVHEVVGRSYYDTALTMLKERTPIEHVYVFSDDIQWCKDALSFAYPTTFVGPEFAGERAIGHFELMRACTHFIIPNSSFSWWAAWLGTSLSKAVIAPKQWFKDATIDTTDLVPPQWIRI